MLKINMEYRKGILFIRLKGELTKFNYLDLINYLSAIIRDKGIKYLVFNLSYLDLVDNYGKDAIKTIISEVKRNSGKGLVCKTKINFEEKVRIIDSELCAMQILKV